MNDVETLAETYRQLGSISAVLGGLAFTAAAAILAVGAGTANPRALTRPASVTAGASVASAACLVVTSIAWSLLTIQGMAAAATGRALDPGFSGLNRPVALIFMMGVVLLFVAVGASGWIGSRALGLTTSGIAAVMGLLALFFMLWIAS